ncbi:MAG TPA: wax ester/triacylglycerol synthase domain-containing protein, partial [Solirubrobacteraceae bacterium]|nr:wax ester/triacylglycerol synthase domain-containing protein [Solirubrobacteraceae bacterium]
MARHAMNSPDAAWLRMDRPTNLMVITSVLWFDAPLPLDAVRAIFRDRLVAPFARFRQRADAGGAGRRPAWVDDDQFDIGLHIHHLALPAPGDRAVLQDVVSDLAVRPLDPSRPLWEVHLLDGYRKGCALVVRMHHAIADGILLARVMMSLTDGAEAVHSRAPRPRTRQLPLPGPLGAAAGAARAGVSIAREAVGVARHPERVPGVARAAAQDGRTLLKLLLPASDPDSAVHGELVPAHHVAWTEPVPLERVRETGRRHGATINDVVVAAVAGAVGRSLRRNGDAVPSIHALVPFNLRPLDGELDPRLGNRFGLVLLPLPTNVHGRSARIHAAHEQMLAIKRSNEGPLSYGILGLIGLTPAMVE